MIKNIIANYLGRFWSILSNILFIPLYIRLLGMEGYSIIGFSIVLTGILAILDAGLTATLSREFASASRSMEEKRNVFHTLETIYIIIAAVIILVFLFSAGWISTKWLNAGSIPAVQIAACLRIIGAGIAFQLLSQFYWGGLMGMEKQVLANVYQVILGIVRNGLVLIPLIFIPDLKLFFLWQSCSMLVYAFVVRRTVATAVSLHESERGFLRIKLPVLKETWRFAGGIMLISLVAAINTQMDKLAISKLLPIEILGYYTLAVALAQGLTLLIGPVGSAVLPRLTAYYSGNMENKGHELFQTTFRASNLILFAFAFNMAFNSRELLWIWTNNPDYADSAAIFMPYLILGMTMLALQVIPYNVALANGYTRYNNYLGLLSLVVTLPGYWFMTSIYGSVGASIVWGFVQTLIAPVYLYLIRKKFIRDGKTFIFFASELLIPALFALSVALIFSRMDLLTGNRWLSLSWIGFSTVITLALSLVIFFSKQKLMLALSMIRGLH